MSKYMKYCKVILFFILAQAAITEHHRVGGFNRTYFLIVKCLDVQDQCASRVGF